MPKSSRRPEPNPKRPMRPRPRPDSILDQAERKRAAESADAAYRASRREAEDLDMREFAQGGMVRGCGPAQMSGKGFRGDF